MNTKKLIPIPKHLIIEELTVCPYCMEDQKGFSCCGENHFELAYLTKDLDCYLDSEVIIIE